MNVHVGDQLPPLEVPITTTLVVVAALASRDFQDVHHDAGLARASGAKDVFMNILTTNGFVGRFITDWSGPDAIIKKVSIRLGVPNYPGDTMKLTGAVKSIDGNEVDIDVRGANSLGDHVTGTVKVQLPQ
ncbi:MAG TPA: MaoC family dehydratase [Actinomycetota bacterium]|nr:MaoC family dehydratase [Actinomycetota bacterium]